MTTLPAVIDGTPGVSSPLEILLFGIGAASSICTFAVIVWRIAKPHVRRYVESVVEPLRGDLELVREEVKPNHGSSLHDQAVKGHKAAKQNTAKLDEVADAVEALAGKLDDHMIESREYLSAARALFEEQGITLPDHEPAEGT